MIDEPWDDGSDCIWCDLCGWGDTVNWYGSKEDQYHFCHRHKADEVRDWWQGRILGYFERQRDLFDGYV